MFSDLECVALDLENADAEPQVEPFERRSESHMNVVSSTSSISTSTRITCASMNRQKIKYKNLQKKCQRLSNKLNACMHKLKVMKQTNKDYEEKLKNLSIFAIEKGCLKGDTKAEFLKDQLEAFGKKKHRWNHKSIKYCVLWYSKSPSAYRFARGAKLLSLPSRPTLKRYVGSTSGTNISSLIKQRLIHEASRISDLEKFCSLILDEMAIKPASQYMKLSDEFLGNVSLNGLEKDMGVEDILANKLLCFLLVGLSTNYKIPVAYFFTNGLKGNELHQLILHVLEEVEKASFKVIRVVADNHSSNVKLFGLLADGHPQPVVQHPHATDRILFLSYDASHIIKNFRSLLLSHTRSMKNKGKPVSGHFIQQLYQLQKESIIKPVRRLTYKHVYPSNLDKMNVQRAVDIFSADVIAALKFLERHGERFGVTSFKDAEGTIEFLQNIRKWFTILNVGNTSFGILSRQADAMHFFSVDDERLCWLENDFIDYLSNWNQSCVNEEEFISKETYEAACLTTRSSVCCIKFLLRSGFQYVLTRKFSSDAIENLFSSIRRLGGSNDQATAASVTQNLHKILVTGLIAGSLSSNTPSISCEEWFQVNDTKEPSSTSFSGCSDVSKLICQQMEIHGKSLSEKPCGGPLLTLENATMAYIGGYLSRIVEENMECINCISLLTIPQSASPLMVLIKDKDLGGLRYPCPEFVFFLIKLQKAVDALLPLLFKKPNVLKNMKKLLLPCLLKNPMFSCGKIPHCEKLCILILNKFIRPYLSNYCKTVTDACRRQNRPCINKKPLSRKLLKVVQN